MPCVRLAVALSLSVALAWPQATAAQTLAPKDLQATYDATPNGGIISIPSGTWPSAGWWTPFRPTKSDPTKSVLWNVTTPNAPNAAIGDNDVTESFWGGHVNFMRNVFTGAPGGPTLFVTLDDYSRGYNTIHYDGNSVGEFPDVPALQVNASTHPNSLGQVNGVEINIDSQGNNPFASEDQGLNIKLNKRGSNSTWAISTLSNDMSGRPPGAFATIAGEYDIYANGPDDPASLYDPLKGNRIFLWMVGKVSPVPLWLPNQHYAIGDRILTTLNGTQTVFVAQTAGTSAAFAPAWPASGQVQDGNILWTYGEPYAVSFGRAIALDGQKGQPVTFSTGFSSNASFANAVIDLSTSKLLRPESAGIRLASNMPIDFSANATAVGQNQHTLIYSTAQNALVYTTNNTPTLSISPGHIATVGRAPTLSCGDAVLSSTASDRHGTITPGATTCTITFATAYTTPPDCQLTAWTVAQPTILSVTTTTLIVSTRGKFSYLCEQ